MNERAVIVAPAMQTGGASGSGPQTPAARPLPDEIDNVAPSSGSTGMSFDLVPLAPEASNMSAIGGATGWREVVEQSTTSPAGGSPATTGGEQTTPTETADQRLDALLTEHVAKNG